MVGFVYGLLLKLSVRIGNCCFEKCLVVLSVGLLKK